MEASEVGPLIPGRSLLRLSPWLGSVWISAPKNNHERFPRLEKTGQNRFSEGIHEELLLLQIRHERPGLVAVARIAVIFLSFAMTV